MTPATLAKLNLIVLATRQIQKEIMAPTLDAAPESRADAITRQAPPITRPLSDEERGRLAIEHAFLVQRERWLEDEAVALKRKYEELRRAIAEEQATLRSEQQRIMNGLRFGLIEEPAAPVLDLAD